MSCGFLEAGAPPLETLQGLRCWLCLFSCETSPVLLSLVAPVPLGCTGRETRAWKLGWGKNVDRKTVEKRDAEFRMLS